MITGRSLETVSLDLKAALSDLEDLQQALSTSAPVRADDNTQLADMGTRFFKGLSAVHLVCNTGCLLYTSLYYSRNRMSWVAAILLLNRHTWNNGQHNAARPTTPVQHKSRVC